MDRELSIVELVKQNYSKDATIEALQKTAESNVLIQENILSLTY
jgi:hypothetical protein